MVCNCDYGSHIHGCYKVFLHDDNVVRVVFHSVAFHHHNDALAPYDVLALYGIQACDMALCDVRILYDVLVLYGVLVCDILVCDVLALCDIQAYDILACMYDMFPVFCDAHRNVVVVYNDHNDVDLALLHDELAYALHDAMDNEVPVTVYHVELELVLLTQMPNQQRKSSEID